MENNIPRYELHVPEPPYEPPVPPTPPSPSSSTIGTIPRPEFTSNYTLLVYKNSADNRKLNKSSGLSSPLSFNISMKEGENLLNPVFKVKSTNDLTKYNYAKIDELGRYYYLNAERLINEYQYVLSLEQDHLMTYKDDILRLVCIIDKQEEIFNELIDDGSYVSQVDDFMNRYSFTTGFNANPCNILICAGGGVDFIEGGSITCINSEHITITSNQLDADEGEPVYILVNAQSGYAVDTLTVTVNGQTIDITDSLDAYGQYHYECTSDAPLTFTVTETSA